MEEREILVKNFATITEPVYMADLACTVMNVYAGSAFEATTVQI